MPALDDHRAEYHTQLWTTLTDLVPAALCEDLTNRLKDLIKAEGLPLVDHEGLGTRLELDGGGRYLHYLADGAAVRSHFPELTTAYHVLLPLVRAITLRPAVLSPYSSSDVNIKAYPPGGGTVGPHYDTNAITVLLYLTANTEAPLRLWSEMHDPWSGTDLADPQCEYHQVKLQPSQGTLLVMQGRRIWHDSEPTINEFKAVAIFNYYWEGDVRRPDQFDPFVYQGRDPRLA